MIHFPPLIDMLLHIDIYLNNFVTLYGFWTYLALFFIIFCETGLIILPFLPGDSLLFAAGSLAAQDDNSLGIGILFILLYLASVLGNQINFLTGRAVGLRAFKFKFNSRFFNPGHIQQAHAFYEKHGGKTLIFARFLPIIRTFVPFVAGVAQMNSLYFILYNLAGGLLWIGGLLGLGYSLGSLPLIKNHFSVVIYTIIGISLLPPFLAGLTRKMH